MRRASTRLRRGGWGGGVSTGRRQQVFRLEVRTNWKELGGGAG